MSTRSRSPRGCGRRRRRTASTEGLAKRNARPAIGRALRFPLRIPFPTRTSRSKPESPFVDPSCTGATDVRDRCCGSSAPSRLRRVETLFATSKKIDDKYMHDYRPLGDDRRFSATLHSFCHDGPQPSSTNAPVDGVRCPCSSTLRHASAGTIAPDDTRNTSRGSHHCSAKRALSRGADDRPDRGREPYGSCRHYRRVRQGPLLPREHRPAPTAYEEQRDRISGCGPERPSTRETVRAPAFRSALRGRQRPGSGIQRLTCALGSDAVPRWCERTSDHTATRAGRSG